VVEGRVKHHDGPPAQLSRGVRGRQGHPRGWRLEKGARSAQIDAVIALAMAVEAAERRPAPVELLGWI